MKDEWQEITQKEYDSLVYSEFLKKGDKLRADLLQIGDPPIRRVFDRNDNLFLKVMLCWVSDNGDVDYNNSGKYYKYYKLINATQDQVNKI